MGRQSARLLNDKKDHKDIFFNGHYHKQMWITDKNANPTLLWEKLAPKVAFTFTVRDTMVGYFDDDWSPPAGTIRLVIASFSDYMTIDWGDGTTEKTMGSNNSFYGITHTYPTSNGTLYTVNVYGEIESFYPTILMQSSYNSCIEEIITPFPKSLCKYLYEDISALFMYNKAIKKIPEYLFSECSEFADSFQVNGAFTQSGLEVAPANLFYGMKKFYTSPFIQADKLISVSPLVFNGVEEYLLDNAFNKCTSLLHAPGEIFSLFNGTSANSTFGECTALLSVSSISNSSLESLQSTFYNCTKLETAADISISTLKTMNSTFYQCYSLKKVGTISCENLEEMTSTFYNCTSLLEAPIIESKSLISMTSTFYGCTALENVQDINSSTLKTMTSTFAQCDSIKELPNINCENLESMRNTFAGCGSITSIPEGFLDNCPNVTDVRYAFKDCSGITGNVPELWKLEQITKYDRCFAGCVNASNYNDIPNDWK